MTLENKGEGKGVGATHLEQPHRRHAASRPRAPPLNIVFIMNSMFVSTLLISSVFMNTLFMNTLLMNSVVLLAAWAQLTLARPMTDLW